MKIRYIKKPCYSRHHNVWYLVVWKKKDEKPKELTTLVFEEENKLEALRSRIYNANDEKNYTTIDMKEWGCYEKNIG